MPRIVNHEERRRELAEAVWRVLLRDGVEGVSVREVAVEAGWSAGALRHYLATKEELLASAARLLEERVVERVARRPDGLTPKEAVREMLCVMLPLDEEREVEGRVWLAFANRSLVDEKIAVEFQGIIFDGIREMCARITHDMAALGILESGRNPNTEAYRLHALIDGLAMHGFLGRIEAGEILALLDTHLDEIFR